MRTLAVTLSLALASGALASGAEDPRATFQALEAKLMKAIAARDVPTLKAVVAPAFAWAIAFEGRPNSVANRSEWIKGGQNVAFESFDIGGLVAETFGDLALVHFRLTGSARLGKAAEMAGGYVVTDLWEKSGRDWKLLRRFVSASAPPPEKK